MSKKIVIIKIGTGVVTRELDGTLDEASLVRLVTAISKLVADGALCVMVSSGAVGAGVSALNIEGYPDDTVSRQAAAAVGQTRLMHAYENLFQKFRLNVAQILVSPVDLDKSNRSRRVTNTIYRLLEAENIVPIINENDSIAVDELKVGDNDMLSAKIAQLLNADLLVMLSTVGGLQHADGSIITHVDDINTVLGHVRNDHGKFSIGGMASKLKAVQFALDAGVETVIASGREPSALSSIASGGEGGTRFSL